MTQNQISYFKAKEEEKHNRATEAEQSKHNRATEFEENRKNLAQEAETHRKNVMQEGLASYSNITDRMKADEVGRHNKETELHTLANMGLSESGSYLSLSQGDWETAAALKGLGEALDTTQTFLGGMSRNVGKPESSYNTSTNNYNMKYSTSQHQHLNTGPYIRIN